MLKRERYLSAIRPYYDSELIKVLTGVRRCGKSTMIKLIIDELSARVGGDRIIYYDFEDFDNEVFLDNPHLFYDRLKERTASGGKFYIFIDEIQYLREYEQVLASIRSKLDCLLFVTGSTSSLLAGELASRLSGRTIEFHINPFSFAECLEYTGEDADTLFDDYLKWGGFPFRFNSKSGSRMYAGDLYQGILKRDIFNRHDLASQQSFRNFCSYVMSRSGEVISASSITSYLASIGEPVSVTTCNKYLQYMTEAFLVSECRRFDIKGKAALETRSKYYAVDPAFITVQAGRENTNLGFVLETIVYNELVSRGYDVYTGKTYKGEVDFVVSDRKDALAYIQVCYLLSDDSVIEREFGAYGCVKDNFPKYVISCDKVDFSRGGIRHLNILDFLTKPVFL